MRGVGFLDRHSSPSFRLLIAVGFLDRGSAPVIQAVDRLWPALRCFGILLIFLGFSGQLGNPTPATGVSGPPPSRAIAGMWDFSTFGSHADVAGKILCWSGNPTLGPLGSVWEAIEITNYFRLAGFMTPMVKKSHAPLVLQFRPVGNSHAMPGRVISVGKSHKFRRRRSATRNARSGNPTFPTPARQTLQHHESI
ncbi:hypothetical protein Acry_3441 (plasmid) [Acidiphilium cryptum JF-5]|uniref:Uncharacterized protein n=1 Tax=Acidiphilium cryptum (strain JF-5) TaxID=349163 RepID=A5FTW3_ACICJ|nr:hypothetical protein Acry_3441 [Acidiphilium cryptum JF-5]